MQDNIVWVVGGVSIDQEYEILMLDLIKQTWHGYVFDTPVSSWNKVGLYKYFFSPFMQNVSLQHILYYTSIKKTITKKMKRK